MRTLGWLIALLVNCSVLAAFVPSAFNGDVIAFAVSAWFIAIGALLVTARIAHVPYWGYSAMRVLCFTVPIAGFVGSLDSGRISGLEFYSLVFAVLFAWGVWKAFLLYCPRPNSSVNPDVAQAPGRLP